MATGASGTYQQSGPSSPQAARAVLAELPGQVSPLPLPAFLNTNFSKPNSNLVIQSRTPGASAITVAFTAAGANQALAVTVASNAITVALATDASSAPASTAAQVRDAINTTPASSALVAAALSEGDGSGIVSAFGTTALAGNANTGAGVLGNAPLPSQHPNKNTYR